MTLKFFVSSAIFFLSALNTSPSFAQSNSTSSSYKPGQTFRDCPTCPEMVVIPAGSFMMGAKENESGSYPEEKPQHQVTIKQFACGKFDITKEQWAAFVKETNRPATCGCSWTALPDSNSQPWDPNPAANWNHLGFAQDSSHPVVCITWYDASDYVQWLSKKTGFVYRMLTEAEWEYVARAGTTTAYYWGDSASHEYANYGTDTSWGVGLAKGRDKWSYTSPVGSFPPNPFGLYDIVGNVMQYTEDCFFNSYNNLASDGTAFKTDTILKITGDLSAMTGTNSCSYRIVRGGNFGDPPGMLRSAYRNWIPGPGSTIKDYSSSGLGLRIARIL